MTKISNSLAANKQSMILGKKSGLNKVSRNGRGGAVVKIVKNNMALKKSLGKAAFKPTSGMLGGKQEQLSDYAGADAEKIKSRVARAGKILKAHFGKLNSKNTLLVTVKGSFADGIRKKTVIMQSAGLGGKHPLDGKRKVSHTEAIFVGLKDHLAVGKDVEVVSIFSSNQACDNSPAHPNGCQSIPRSEFGVDENVTFTFGAGYKTGGRKEPTFNFNKMAKVTGMADGNVEQHYSSDSEDELIDTNSLRGKELGSRVNYDDALVDSFRKLNVDSKVEEMKKSRAANMKDLS